MSDSGTIPEEAGILGLPAVQVRLSSERPEAYDEGVLILSGLNKNIILQAIKITTEEVKNGEKFKVPEVYSNINTSSKVLRHIVGLTNIVKRRRANGFY